jgi:hypothetical protein
MRGKAYVTPSEIASIMLCLFRSAAGKKRLIRFQRTWPGRRLKNDEPPPGTHLFSGKHFVPLSLAG